jgi:xylulokinase
VRGIVEAQMAAMALHSRWMRVAVETIYATGGAAANRAMLQVMADVFGADVYQFAVANSACLGAALCARQAHAAASGLSLSWNEVVSGVTAPVAASRLEPDRSRHAMYREFVQVYAQREAEALSA